MEQRLLANARVPVVGFIASPGNRETALLSQVIELLRARRVRVAVVKEAKHDFDMDQPGKDSYRLRKAGVERLLITSSRKSALILEHPGATNPTLNDLLALLHQDVLDVVLVEGFSQQVFPKIVLQRGNSPLLRDDDNLGVIAIATDCPTQLKTTMPILNINEPPTVAEFLISRIHASKLS